VFSYFAGMYNIALIEDNVKIQQVLGDFVSAQPDFKLLFKAGSYEEFTHIWKGRKLDLVLCDIGLPGKSGIDAAWYIKAHSPDTQILMLTVFEEKEKIFAALCAGASGYMLKSTPLSEIRTGIKEILDGGAAMSPRIARQVAEFFYRRPASFNDTEQLSSREVEIISLIRQGLSNKEVSDKLFISTDTIKYHIKNIYRKLQVGSRAELIRRYQEV
jgi:DNA-binding NarL/FixJ family response regulator